MKRVCSILILCVISVNLVFAQDIHFSQTDQSHLNLNPALTGFEHDLNISLNYKTQWNPTNVPYRTYAASADMLFRPNSRSNVKMASGIMVFRDNAGDPQLSTTAVNANFAVKLKINEQNDFGAGMYLGYRQVAIQGADGQWASQFNGQKYDPDLASGEQFAKMSFGGLGKNPFNPALVGRVFLLMSFPVQMTSWPIPRPIFGGWYRWIRLPIPPSIHPCIQRS